MSAVTAAPTRRAGVILAGGQSERMGQSKALLPFGPEVMLTRMVRILSEVLSPVLVVAAAGQELPDLPASVQVLRDRRPERGPLEGLANSLSALQGQAHAVYVSGCDLPLLTSAFINRVLDRLESHDAAVPQLGGHWHPLAAAYHPRLAAHLEQRLAANRLKLFQLYDEIDTRVLGASDLADVDPRSESLLNMNEPADYQRALAIAGFGPA